MENPKWTAARPALWNVWNIDGPMPTRPRALGIIRVSKVGKRATKGDRFISPGEQEKAIRATCAFGGLDLVGLVREMDVKSDWPLSRREGLRSGVEAVESGEIQVLVSGYFDRFFRDLNVQREVMDRVEEAGGKLLAADFGEIRADTPMLWLSSSMMGLVSELHRRMSKHHFAKAKASAIERGVPPFPTLIPGYRRGDDGVSVVEPVEAEHVKHAFKMRADGASIFEIREYLCEHNIPRTYRSTQTLLKSRIVLGELRNGKHVNKTAHDPIIDEGLWRAVQNVSSPRRGDRKPSDRLLARLGVLRCATCNGAMGVTWGYKTRGGKRYWKYFCGRKTECEAPAMISATVAEEAVVAETRRRVAEENESASAEDHVAEAELELAQAQEALNAAVNAFDGINAAAVNEKLRALQADVDAATEQVRMVRAASIPTQTINASGNWDDLSFDAQRAIIRVAVPRVLVHPGRIGARIEFEPLSQ